MPQRLKLILLASAGALVLAAAMLWLGFQAAVRAKLADVGERREVELSVDRIRPGFFRVWLDGVNARIAKVPAAHIELDRVEVQLGWLLSPRAVKAHGGRISLVGTWEEIMRQARSFRAEQRRNSKAGPARSGGLAYSFRGLDVVQRDSPSARRQALLGLSYHSEDDGQQSVHFDKLDYASAGLQLDMSNVTCWLSRADDQRQIEQLKAGELFTKLDIDALLKRSSSKASSSAGKDSTRAEHRDVPSGFAIDDGRRARWATLLRLLREELALRIKSGGQLELENLKTVVEQGESRVHLGPNRLLLRRSAEQLSLSLRPEGMATGPALELRALVPLAGGPARLELLGGPVSLASLGVREGDFGLRGVKTAKLEGKGTLVLSADQRHIDFDGRLAATDLSIHRQALARKPLTDIDVGLNGRGRISTDGRRLRLEEGVLSLRDLQARMELALSRDEEDLHVQMKAQVPATSCQKVLAAAPSGLLPSVARFKLSGNFALNSQLDFDSASPLRSKVQFELHNGCHVDRVPPELEPANFFGRWRRTVIGKGGEPMQVESGPGTVDWVDYGDISRHMETAVLVCEDGRFFRHEGFDQEAIENSIKENLKSKKFVRGASTISMQLAKNLYLSREKALSRKLEEAAFTVLLEQELSKRELMELYLNVIEYGPGIYGIGPAADHYFKSTPAELSLGQSLYLASILPNPKGQHFGEDGKLSEGWSNYIRKLMGIALKIKRITEQEYEEGLEEQVEFGVPYVPSNPYLPHLSDPTVFVPGLDRHTLLGWEEPLKHSVRGDAGTR